MKNRLKELRQQHQRSQSDIARALRVSRQAINGFESGKFDPSLDMAFKLANLFNVAIEDVFIYEAKNSMQTLVERVKNFFGLEFGFERFTDQAIYVINVARYQAVRSQSSQVEPEQLLLGLLTDPTTTAAQLLQSSGATFNLDVDQHPIETSETLKLSSESKFVLELALQIVRLQGKQSIDTEHLLWALVRLAETNKTSLSDLFEQYNIDLQALNNQLIDAI